VIKHTILKNNTVTQQHKGNQSCRFWRWWYHWI